MTELLTPEERLKNESSHTTAQHLLAKIAADECHSAA
jgi:hypothetical protein